MAASQVQCQSASARPALKIVQCQAIGNGDLLFGDAYSQIATLVERHTRYVMLVKLVDEDSYTVGAALARHAQTLPRQLYLSLT